MASAGNGARADLPEGGVRSRRRLVFRTCFVGYWIALAVATHWPQLDLGPAPFDFFDKALHVGAYAVWTWLLLLTGWLGPAGEGRTLWKVLLAAGFWAAVDEATQAIPGVNRSASALDWAADMAGAALAIGLYRTFAQRP